MLCTAGTPTRGTTTTTIIGALTDTATGGVTKPSRTPGSALDRRSSGAGPGDLAKDRTRDEAGATRIVEIEQAAHELASGVEAGNRLLRGVEHVSVGVDAQAAKGEGDTTSRAIRLVGRFLQRHRPVGFFDLQPFGRAPIFDRRVIGDIALHRGVVLADRLEERALVDRGAGFRHLVGQRFESVGGDLGHPPDAVFVALQVDDLLVEDLPGELVRLVQNLAAVFGIGVVPEIGSLVAEALA